MEKIICLYVFLSIILVSCKQELNTDPFLNTGEKIAVEFITHVKRIEKTEKLNNESYAAFLSPELLAQINGNGLTMKQVVATEPGVTDTIHMFAEIPVIKEIVTRSAIYMSGKMFTEIRDITPEDENIPNTITEIPLLPEQTIRKTISANGMLTSYGADGNILSAEPYEVPDMKPFLDSLKFYQEIAIRESEAISEIEQTAVERIKMQAGSLGMQVSSNEQGNMIIEEIINPKVAAGMRIKGIAGQIRSRTITNAAMDRTLQFELYQGNQLISRRSYQYNGDEKLKNSWRIKGNDAENPAVIISEILFVNNMGIPQIKKTIEAYKQNQMIVYF